MFMHNPMHSRDGANVSSEAAGVAEDRRQQRLYMQPQ